MELKVFTLPTCSGCPVAKMIAFEVAQKFGIAYRIVDMATDEGLNEGLAYDIRSTPSIVIDEEVIVRGQLISKEKLEEEVRKRLEKWRARASSE
ncbi:MAG: thioredoxin family protein [Candidatus Bathyarchaeia archaeon]|nr:thioredoxin family protein [Candidatus Bathyarchaeia archaeon]MDI6905445.1 thioredoxin family protein [Candidatus Bathyarchaeia archaeon]